MKNTGPFVAAAFFCEKVIEDREGVLSAIRIVDRVVLAVVGAEVPEVMPPTLVSLTLLLSFKSGEAKGRHEVKIMVENPAGIQAPLASGFSVHFEGPDQGQNLVLNLNFTATLEGLYWFDVHMDDDVVTRVPLRLVYQRQALATGPQPRPGS